MQMHMASSIGTKAAKRNHRTVTRRDRELQELSIIAAHSPSIGSAIGGDKTPPKTSKLGGKTKTVQRSALKTQASNSACALGSEQNNDGTSKQKSESECSEKNSSVDCMKPVPQEEPSAVASSATQEVRFQKKYDPKTPSVCM